MTAGATQLRNALEEVAATLGVEGVAVTLERPRESSHGDLATNLALQLAKRLGRKPRDLAQEIIDRLAMPDTTVARMEIAGPGFINFWLADDAVTQVLATVLEAGAEFGRSSVGRGRKVNVEFVSANPTGPLHVGHGRGAALGDAIASVLEATGHEVVREFYVNDAGVQIDRLAESLWARVQNAVGREGVIPEGGYHGEYLVELAERVLKDEGGGFADLPREEGLRRCREIAVADQREEQRRDLEAFRVNFDVYSNESELYEGRMLADTLAVLESHQVVYENEGALWLRTSDFGDEKDRVLRKRDGTFTYFLPDIAYHRTKADRQFDTIIDVWGADHHGYIARMRAALRALGLPDEFFEVALVQLVRVIRHGEEVRFSKRAGDYVTLRELFEQTGVDAARYFFLLRRGDSQFVFDIDLATKQSLDNPVYYVQYAHTRMAGIFRHGGVAKEELRIGDVDLSLLTQAEELDLAKRLGEFPGVIESAAKWREPHRVINYLYELARLVQTWYHRGNDDPSLRVIGVDPPLQAARLVLARGAQIVLANGLNLLGISAPDRM